MKSLPKRATKKMIRPFVGPIIRMMHVKILGKQVLMNRYTRKIPIVEKIAKITESKMLITKAFHDRETEYRAWQKKNYPKKKELREQSSLQKDLTYRPLISVLLPTYNTNPELLRQCLDSVLQQSYDNWELCIADDKSTDRRVVEILEGYASKDKRIKYIVREKNGHICHATNTALGMAKGDFVALLDHDDFLWPNALYKVAEALNANTDIDFIYSDEEKISEKSDVHSEPFFKPDWSPEYLRSVNYITHFAVLRKTLVDKIGGFRPGYEGAQDWDLFLRASRETSNIYHIPTVLYSWRKTANSTAERPSAKSYAYVNQKKALADDVKERGLKADIEWEIPFSMWRVSYELKSKYLVSIIIPTKDQFDFIERCLRSIYEKTNYDNLEIVVTDTGSTDDRVWALYDEYKAKFTNMKVVRWTKPFNFASTCNYGAKKATGKYYLFLNNDTEVITESWIEDMLGYAQQESIGAVGCKLLYPDGKLQHGGIVLGVGGQNGTPGIAGHYFPAFINSPPQDPAQQLYVGGTRNFTAVTAACVMVERSKFEAVGGFDPRFKIAFNDVDFCLKLFNAKLRNVYLPHVQLYHYESVSIGKLGTKQRDPELFNKEINLMLKKWKPLIDNDPYYHPEFRRDVASARLGIINQAR